MNTGTVKICSPKHEAKYIWKYFDIHRFIYFLTQQKLVFTRLDKLDDVFEGIETRHLRNDSRESSPKLLQKLSKNKQVSGIKKSSIVPDRSLAEIEKAQKTQYVNCWFTGDRESMAMWNVYSNPDSVALRASFAELTAALKNPFQDFINAYDRRFSIIGDQITYLKLNPFDETKLPKKVKFSALKKDVSFAYENEYRFLIYTKRAAHVSRPFYSIPVEPEKMAFTIVTHPNMEDWKYKNIEKLVQLSRFNIDIEKSNTILRKR
jgi:hypothetical protein